MMWRIGAAALVQVRRWRSPAVSSRAARPSTDLSPVKQLRAQQAINAPNAQVCRAQRTGDGTRPSHGRQRAARLDLRSTARAPNAARRRPWRKRARTAPAGQWPSRAPSD